MINLFLSLFLLKNFQASITYESNFLLAAMKILFVLLRNRHPKLINEQNCTFFLAFLQTSQWCQFTMRRQNSKLEDNKTHSIESLFVYTVFVLLLLTLWGTLDICLRSFLHTRKSFLTHMALILLIRSPDKFPKGKDTHYLIFVTICFNTVWQNSSWYCL